jgi:hypothetical protein
MKAEFVLKALKKSLDSLPPNFIVGDTWESIEFPEGHTKPTKIEFEDNYQEVENEEQISTTSIIDTKFEVGTANLFVDTITSNVGVGTSSPAYKLDVDGNVHAEYFIGDGSQLDGISSTLQQITDNGNTTSNTIQFTNEDVGLVATGNIEANYFIGDGTLLSNVVNDTDLQSNVTILRGEIDSNLATARADLQSNVTILRGEIDSNLATARADLQSNVTTLKDTTITFMGIKTFEDDVILESNLRIQGDLLVANTVNMTVSDPILELGSNNQNTGDVGLVMTRHGTSNSNVAVFFDESTDILKLGYTLDGANDSTLELDSNSLAVSVQGAFTAASLSGDGSGLTTLNASNLSSGTVPSAMLSLGASDIPNLDADKITKGTLTRPISTTSVTATTLHYPAQTIQPVLNGGGTVTFNASAYIKWSNRVIAIPVERTEMGASGYIDITCPTSGTITYFSGASGSTTAACTADGIPMSTWEALYYVVTPGQSNASDQTRFRKVYYQNSTWDPDSNWILICARNGDGSELKWLPGQTTLAPGQSYNSTTRGTPAAAFADSATTATNQSGGTVSATTGTFSGDLTVGTANLFVDVSTSNVGIGTSSPAYTLDVAGKVAVPDDGDFVMNSKPLTSASGLHWDTVNSRLGVGTASPAHTLDVVGNLAVNTDDLFVNAGTGRVGVNRNNPLVELDVNGTVSATHLSLGTRNRPTIGGNWLSIFSPTYDGAIGDNHPDPDGGILFTNGSSNGSFPWGYYMGVVKDVASTSNTSLRFDIGKSNDIDTQNRTGGENTLTPYLTIDNGNVGIGTTSPGAKLDVAGTVAISSNLAVNTDDFFVDTVTSNVGIGTSSPAYTLDVHGTSNVGALTVTSVSGDGSGLTELNASNVSSGEIDNARLNTASTTGAGIVQLSTSTSGTSTTKAATESAVKAAYDRNSWAAGTFSGDLTLSYTSGAPTLQFKSTESVFRQASDWEAYFTAREASIERYADKQVYASGSGPLLDTTHRIKFGYSDTYISNSGYYPTYHEMHFEMTNGTNNNSGTLTRIMTLRDNGNVGIGTTSPSYKLHVNGTLNSGALTATSVTVPDDGDFVMNSKPLTSATGLHWDTGNSRLGVGKASPAFNLDVLGTGSFTSELYYNKWIRNNGTGASGLYWQNASNPGYKWHIYPQSQSDMTMRTGSGNGGIKGTVADATARGYIHWTTSNEIGFLNSSRAWSLRMDNSKNCEVYGGLKATTGTFSGALEATSGTFSGDLTVGTANLFVDTATSNVGIGTTSPAYNLDVHGSANVGALTVTSVSGLEATDIPSLNASKITGGTLGSGRIPNLNASKITAGTLGRPISTTTGNFSDTLKAGTADAYRTREVSTLRKDWMQHEWGQPGTAASTDSFYYATSSALNGDSSYSTIVTSTDPYGRSCSVWRNTGAANNAGGGWNVDFPINANRSYMSIVYVRRTGATAGGSFYHGCSNASTKNLTGTDNGNPYFTGGYGISALPQDVWCVSIGFIHYYGAGESDATGMAGIYRLDTMQKIKTNSEFAHRYAYSATVQRYQTHRVYLFYNTTSGVQLDFWNPGFFEHQTTFPETSLLKMFTNSLVATNAYIHGNVGIGTTSPAAKLHVVGDIGFPYGNAIRVSPDLVTSWPNGTTKLIEVNWGTGDEVRFFTPGSKSATQKMVINSSGNVGIGTTDPGSKLHINPNTTSTGSPGTTGVYVYNTGTGDATCTMRVKDSNAGDPYISFDVANEAGWSWGMDNSDSNKMKLGANWDTLTTNTKMTIDTSGNVGIGTTSPVAKLHVYDGTAQSSWRNFYVRPTSLWGDGLTTASETAGTKYMTANMIMLQGPHITPSSAGTNAYIRYGRAGGVAAGVWWETACVTDGSFRIRREANDAYSMCITSGGNVGIGTTNPGSSLHVLGQVYATGAFYTDSNRSVIRGHSPTLYFRDTSHMSAMIHNDGDRLYVLRGGMDTEEWSSVNSQWPWIFNLSNNDSTCGGSLYCVGNVTAYSDRRHKTDIVKLDNAVEKVEKLSGYTYTRINDGKRYTGLIAQEVLEVLPEAVNTDEKGEYSLAYGNMAGLFVEALKEMNTKFQAEKAKVQTLETQLALVLTRLDALEGA